MIDKSVSVDDIACLLALIVTNGAEITAFVQSETDAGRAPLGRVFMSFGENHSLVRLTWMDKEFNQHSKEFR